jgi:hypothetical protein
MAVVVMGGADKAKSLTEQLDSFSSLPTESKQQVAEQLLSQVRGKTAEYEYGTAKMTASVSNARVWEKGEHSRIYFDISSKNEFKAPRSVYLDISQTGRSNFNSGSFVSRFGTVRYDRPPQGSGTKDREIDRAVRQLFG